MTERHLDVVPLTMRLMDIDSTSGHEGAVIEWLERYLAGANWNTRRIPVTPGRDDLLATSGDIPTVTLSTHLDTVPPYIPPRLDGPVLWGRGACDAKGIAASMIIAAERLRATGVAVALLFVVGEETTHDGAEAANRVPTTSKVLINGEPTESTLAIGTKGAMRFTLRTHGVSAHSAYPHLGRSAITDLVQLLHDLDRVKLPRDADLGDTTINIGLISGGVADNVLAPVAEARLMARLVTPPETLMTLLRDWVGDRAAIEFGITVELARLNVVPGFLTSVVAFATDIPKLPTWGTPYLFGPGSINAAHRDDEHVKVADLHAAVDAYTKLATLALQAATRAGSA
ncbi:MAG TPA: M20/M25/M40 family metallo-hydrolase [Gemmatimonadaceae bacterium]|nr:M20/M25/M40 family metallo-hydrolase [Gemmatimonadaceae bacterium]